MIKLLLDFDLFAQQVKNIENNDEIPQVEKNFYLLMNEKKSEKDIEVMELAMMLDNLTSISNSVTTIVEKRKRLMKCLDQIRPCKTKTVWF